MKGCANLYGGCKEGSLFCAFVGCQEFKGYDKESAESGFPLYYGSEKIVENCEFRKS